MIIIESTALYSILYEINVNVAIPDNNQRVLKSVFDLMSNRFDTTKYPFIDNKIATINLIIRFNTFHQLLLFISSY